MLIFWVILKLKGNSDESGQSKQSQPRCNVKSAAKVGPRSNWDTLTSFEI